NEVLKPGLLVEKNPRTRSGALAEMWRDAQVKSRRGCLTEIDPILDQNGPGSRAKSKVLHQDGEWAEIKARFEPGMVEGIQEEKEPPQGGEMAKVRMNKAGGTQAGSEETFGDLVMTYIFLIYMESWHA
ncbi:hypothetical protein XENOCAPTIV_015336, partial [Xenoophorus captivus]